MLVTRCSVGQVPASLEVLRQGLASSNTAESSSSEPDSAVSLQAVADSWGTVLPFLRLSLLSGDEADAILAPLEVPAPDLRRLAQGSLGACQFELKDMTAGRLAGERRMQRRGSECKAR